MVARVNGGILTDQVLGGQYRYYKMIGTDDCFEYTVGSALSYDPNGVPSGGVIIPGQEVKGDEATTAPFAATVTYPYYIEEGKAVPNSVADRAFRVIISKCTVAQISIVSTTEIHFAVENTSNGWDTTSYGDDLSSDADNNMTTAVQALGLQGIVTVPADPSDTPPVIPDLSDTGILAGYDMSNIVITEVEFKLV